MRLAASEPRTASAPTSRACRPATPMVGNGRVGELAEAAARRSRGSLAIQGATRSICGKRKHLPELVTLFASTFARPMQNL